ncbi:MAG TPA: hypothetical protein ENN80_05945 [Candidatus Hydrogenedentes bacterium]|nr:hypothetical protein [Candidatus Hydrogenedentota bacterium]
MEQARRQAEEELRKHREHLKELVEERTRELKAANKELDAFAYSVSHDLRAPLRGIDGFSMALLEDYQDQLDEEGKGYLRRVRAAAQRMGQLIDDLLALSRAIRTDMLLEDIDLGKTAQTILDELREQAPERALEAKVAPDLFVRADRRLLRTVLENLLGNAWKFTACRDTAVIELGVLDVEHGEQGPLRAYYVRDNGAGFDMTYADKLFTPFQRLHTTEEFPGTGIGLATVQRIIHRLGGRVWAEGKVDAGATVYFTVGEKARGSDSREAARSVLSRTQRKDNAHA